MIYDMAERAGRRGENFLYSDGPLLVHTEAQLSKAHVLQIEKSHEFLPSPRRSLSLRYAFGCSTIDTRQSLKSNHGRIPNKSSPLNRVWLRKIGNFKENPLR